MLTALATPAWAGQQVPVTAENPAKTRVFAYETALRSAVEIGGQKLASQAAMVVPQVVLAAAEQPIVRGFVVGGYGFLFDVQAPDIQSTILVWDMVNQTSRSRAARAVEAPPLPVDPSAQPVADRVTATAAVAPDPMAAPAPVSFNPTMAYSNNVREALIDAMLDSSAVLQIAPEEHLMIAASGIDQPNSNPLYRARKLYLTIKGSDLQDLRQGRITRDQAKVRIVEERF
jgi:hypothetical protein